MVDPATGRPSSILDSFQEVSWTRRYFNAGDFSLKLETHDLPGTGLAKGAFLWVKDPNAVGNIYRVEKVQIDTAAQSPPVEVGGRDLGLYLDQRLIIPPVGLSHDTLRDNVESVFYHFVENHLGASAALARRLPNLRLGTNFGRGPVIDVAGRYQYIGEFLAPFAQAYGFGWDVVWDPLAHDFVFSVLQGADRTSTVFIDPEFETAEEIRWLQSEVDLKNWGLIAGQGEKELRAAEVVFSGVEPEGYDRREAFFDARDLADAALLVERGQAALAEMVHEDSFVVTIAAFGSFRYPEDFDLGDIITVRSAEFGLERSARIISVKRTATAQTGGQPTTSIEVGQLWPTLRGRVNQQVAVKPSATGRV